MLNSEDLGLIKEVISSFDKAQTKEDFEALSEAFYSVVTPEIFYSLMVEYSLLRKMEASINQGTTKYKVYVEELYRQRKSVSQLPCPYLESSSSILNKKIKKAPTMMEMLLTRRGK